MAPRRQWKGKTRTILRLLSDRLYKDKIAVIRELMANAVDSDATRIDAETFEINGEKHLSIDDNGRGMCSKEVDKYLLKIGESLSKEYKEKIGEFGIGFISSFSVSYWVLVETIKNRERTVLLLNRDAVIIDLNEFLKEKNDLFEWINSEVKGQKGSKLLKKDLYPVIERQLYKERKEDEGTRVTLFSPYFPGKESQVDDLVKWEIKERFTSIKADVYVDGSEIEHKPPESHIEPYGNESVFPPYKKQTKNNEFYYNFPKDVSEYYRDHRILIKNIYIGSFDKPPRRCCIGVNSRILNPTLDRDDVIIDKNFEKFIDEFNDFSIEATKYALEYDFEKNIKEKEMHERWIDFLILNYGKKLPGEKEETFLEKLLLEEGVREILLKLRVPLVYIPTVTRAKSYMSLKEIFLESNDLWWISGQDERDRVNSDKLAERGDFVMDLDKVRSKEKQPLVSSLKKYLGLKLVNVKESPPLDKPAAKVPGWDDFLKLARDMLIYMNSDVGDFIDLQMADLEVGGDHIEGRIRLSANKLEFKILRNIIENITRGRRPEKVDLFDLKTRELIPKPDGHTVVNYLVETCRELWEVLAHELAHETLGAHERHHPPGFEHQYEMYNSMFKTYRLEKRHLEVLRELTKKKEEKMKKNSVSRFFQSWDDLITSMEDE